MGFWTWLGFGNRADKTRHDSRAEDCADFRAAIESQAGHAVIQEFQPRIIDCELAAGATMARFSLLAFTVPGFTSYIWRGCDDQWGTGGWRRNASTTPLDASYMTDAPGTRNFAQALEWVALTRRGDPIHGLHGAIQSGLSAIYTNRLSDDAIIVSELAGEGIPIPFASRLLTFIPIASCRFVYRQSGVRFAETYTSFRAEGDVRESRPLLDEPIFAQTLQHLDSLAREHGQDLPFLIPIAARSGGFKAIQQSQMGGARLEDIQTSPPIMFDE